MNKKFAYGIVAGIAASTIATFAETNDVAALRSELASVSSRLAELEKSDAAAKSSWADKIQIKGDLRYRYEYQAKDGDTAKSRNRLRGRIGAYAQINDETTTGIRLATGGDESPTSTNQDIDGFGSEKQIWLDLAYFTYSPNAVEGLSGTAGKMKQPWKMVSDLLFDSDVNPEGASLAYDTVAGGIAFNSQLGYFTLVENKTEDQYLITAQLAASAKIAEDIKLTAAVGAFFYDNLEGKTIPTFGGKVAANGNSATGANYTYDYDIVDGSLKLDIDKGPAPVKIYAEVLNNIASDVNEDTAWLVGIGTKIKKLSLDYNYRDMDQDAIVGALADGDFGGPGGKGHRIKASYPIAKNLTLGATYLRITNISDVDIDTAQLDVVVKF